MVSGPAFASLKRGGKKLRSGKREERRTIRGMQHRRWSGDGGGGEKKSAKDRARSGDRDRQLPELPKEKSEKEN